MSLKTNTLALGRIAGGNHLVAAQDEPEPADLTPEDVEVEVRRIQADLAEPSALEKERRRIERAGPSLAEMQFARDHGWLG